VTSWLFCPFEWITRCWATDYFWQSQCCFCNVKQRPLRPLADWLQSKHASVPQPLLNTASLWSAQKCLWVHENSQNPQSSCNVATRACAMWYSYLRIYVTTLSLTLIVGWIVINVLERIWNEPVLVWFGVNSDNELDRVGERTSVASSEIWTPNVSELLTTEPRSSIEFYLLQA
jgi:hypothetical protein